MVTRTRTRRLLLAAWSGLVLGITISTAVTVGGTLAFVGLAFGVVGVLLLIPAMVRN